MRAAASRRAARAPSHPPSRTFELAALSTADARRDVDYAALDRAAEAADASKPAMVGLAVGVVENGRITFLKGYGETTPGRASRSRRETVFRWASVSKGVAATMVAKLAEQGKVDLERAGSSITRRPQASRAATNIARPSATCSATASASTATPMTTSWRRGGTPRFLRADAWRSST